MTDVAVVPLPSRCHCKTKLQQANRNTKEQAQQAEQQHMPPYMRPFRACSDAEVHVVCRGLIAVSIHIGCNGQRKSARRGKLVDDGPRDH